MKKWEEQRLEKLEEVCYRLECIGIADCPKCKHLTIAAGHTVNAGCGDRYFSPDACLVCGTRLKSERKVVSTQIDSTGDILH